MTYETPVPEKEIHHGCACCGGTRAIASLDTPVFLDDGQITKDGAVIYPTQADWDNRPPPDKDYGVRRPLREFEEMALKEPAADWRYTFVKGLRDGTYQRQGDGKWVLIRSGKGYA